MKSQIRIRCINRWGKGWTLWRLQIRNRKYSNRKTNNRTAENPTSSNNNGSSNITNNNGNSANKSSQSVQGQSGSSSRVLGVTSIKKATKKKASSKIKLTFKKVLGASKYQVQISTTKKFKKILVKKTVKKVRLTIKSKKLKNKKKLYVRVRAFGAAKWSKIKKVK